jgi:hypothetical protein
MDVWGVNDEGDKIGYTDDYLVNARRVPVEYIYGKGPCPPPHSPFLCPQWHQCVYVNSLCSLFLHLKDHALTGSDNEEIYNSSVKNLVKSAMEGYNGKHEKKCVIIPMVHVDKTMTTDPHDPNVVYQARCLRMVRLPQEKHM